MCCLKLKLSSKLTPRLETEGAGVTLSFRICAGKKPSSFARCVTVPMMINSVLFAFNFSLLFFIQRETSWRQSLSWFKERQASGVVNEM